MHKLFIQWIYRWLESAVIWQWILSHCMLSAPSSPVLTQLLFTYWGHGLCSWRYHSYLYVLTCSLGTDHNSPSLHCHGNIIHGTKEWLITRLWGNAFCFPVRLASVLRERHVKCLTDFEEMDSNGKVVDFLQSDAAALVSFNWWWMLMLEIKTGKIGLE